MTKEQTPLDLAERPMKTDIMRNASYLLPPPGGEVVRQCLDEVVRLQTALTAANARAERYKGGLEEISELYREVNTLEIATARGIARITLADDAKEGM